MAFCKPTYTVIRHGTVVAMGVTAEVALEKIEADIARVCPTDCFVRITDVDFDGTEYTVTFVGEAPYFALSIGEDIGGITYNIDSPAIFTMNEPELGFLIAGITENLNLQSFCATAIVNAAYSELPLVLGEGSQLLDIAGFDCIPNGGIVTAEIIYTDAAAVSITGGDAVTVTDGADGDIVVVKIVCTVGDIVTVAGLIVITLTQAP